MSTEAGKLEVVSVIDGPAADPWIPAIGRVAGRIFGDGVIVLKVHRSPYAAQTQGDLIIARRNPKALWLSDYEDRIIYDGRLEGAHKFVGEQIALRA
jgi:hypothetical protein